LRKLDLPAISTAAAAATRGAAKEVPTTSSKRPSGVLTMMPAPGAATPWSSISLLGSQQHRPPSAIFLSFRVASESNPAMDCNPKLLSGRYPGMATPLPATPRWSQAGKAGDGSDEFPLAATSKTPREAAYSREFLTPLSLAPYLPKLMLITSTPPSVRATIPSVTAAMPMRYGKSTLGAEFTFTEPCEQALGTSERA